MKILVIAAHPDDEILGMGGTIKKYTGGGHHVKIVIMSTGISSRRSIDFKNSTQYKVEKELDRKMKQQIEKLRNHSKKAVRVVGVDDIEFFDFPDNEMDLVSNLEVTKKIEEVIRKFNPTVVYTHSAHDVNIDHRILYNATITATRPTVKSKIKEVYSFEIPSSSEWNFQEVFTPNTFVEIDKELKYKIKAMSKYVTELGTYPHPRSLEALEIIAKRWGTVSGYHAAEAFTLVRQLKSDINR